jgi:hypothetical protein
VPETRVPRIMCHQLWLGSEEVAAVDAIDTGPLMSWLPDVPSQTYTGLQRYMKSCREVMTMDTPLKKGLGNDPMLRPEWNSSLSCKTELGP